MAKAATKKKPVKKPASSSAKAAAGLPMFFQKPIVLDAGRHGKSAITNTTDYSFARTTNSIGINTLEFIEACKSYPIVFGNGPDFTAVAVVGLDRSNFFVGSNGKWKRGSYIPAYVRQYPFIFFENKSDQRFYLCVDEAAPNYHAKKMKDASPLFDASGKPSPLTSNAIKFCTSVYRHHAITRHFCDDLEKHHLLKPYHSEASLASGKKFKLSGFRMIDETAFNALPDAVLIEFRKKGWLPFIYLALASASNWKQLVDLAARTAEKSSNI